MWGIYLSTDNFSRINTVSESCAVKQSLLIWIHKLVATNKFTVNIATYV